MNIRIATEADLGDLVGLYQQFGPFEDDEPSVAVSRMLARTSLYPDFKVYVAEIDGKIAGTFALLIMDTLGNRCRPAGVVEDVVVSERARDQGIGRAMMEFALERCRERGCYKMALSSNLSRDAAHRFYESLGFEKHGYSFRVPIDP